VIQRKEMGIREHGGRLLSTGCSSKELETAAWRQKQGGKVGR